MIRNLTSRLEKIEATLQPAGKSVFIFLYSDDPAERAQRLQEARNAGRMRDGAKPVFFGWLPVQEGCNAQVH